MILELQQIEIKKSKAGDPAIQLVFKSDDGQWVREYISLDKAPDFVWERWGKCFGIKDTDVNEIKFAMTGVLKQGMVQSEGGGWKTENGKIFDILGSRCEADCEAEEYQGREYVKIKNAKPEGVDEDVATAPDEAPEAEDDMTVNATASEVSDDDDLPF